MILETGKTAMLLKSTEEGMHPICQTFRMLRGEASSPARLHVALPGQEGCISKQGSASALGGRRGPIPGVLSVPQPRFRDRVETQSPRTATGGRHFKNLRESLSYTPLPWHFLYFLPLPQGQGSFRPTFVSTFTGCGFRLRSLAALSVAVSCWDNSPILVASL